MDKREQKATIVALHDDDDRIGRFRYHVLVRAFKAVEVVLDGDKRQGVAEGATFVDLRIYRSQSGETWYACLWLMLPTDDNTGYRYADGSGCAGGWGYDKESAAVAEAFERAGISFSLNFSGAGIEAIEEAIRAVASLADRPYILARCEA